MRSMVRHFDNIRLQFITELIDQHLTLFSLDIACEEGRNSYVNLWLINELEHY